MIEGSGDSAFALWHVPECPFSIEYSQGVLDEIRIATVNAFYAFPHGGAEIGGILLGTRAKDRVRILGFLPLECEHVTGPSFVLSQSDESRLAQLLQESKAHAPVALEHLGWYHSHTRSGIFLSELDLALHNRHFPEPWQIALVLRPHKTQPTRAGFFFRDKSGGIRTESSYSEFSVELRSPDPPLSPSPPPSASTRAIPVEPQRLGTEPRMGRSLRAAWVVLAIFLCLSGAGFATRQYWFPEQVSTVALEVFDKDAQLLIRWNPGSRAIPETLTAILEIVDGSAKLIFALDSPQLQSGSFTYARRTEKVDVRLILQLPGGKRVEEFASFFGKLPALQPSPEDLERERQREEQALETETIKTELRNQSFRTRNLERTIRSLRNQLREREEERVSPPEQAIQPAKPC